MRLIVHPWDNICCLFFLAARTTIVVLLVAIFFFIEWCGLNWQNVNCNIIVILEWTWQAYGEDFFLFFMGTVCRWVSVNLGTNQSTNFWPSWLKIKLEYPQFHYLNLCGSPHTKSWSASRSSFSSFSQHNSCVVSYINVQCFSLPSCWIIVEGNFTKSRTDCNSFIYYKTKSEKNKHWLKV